MSTRDRRLDDRELHKIVRGPDFLSLRTALTHPIRCDGAVVVREPWRALDAADVSSVLGIPVLSNNDESLCLNTDNDG